MDIQELIKKLNDNTIAKNKKRKQEEKTRYYEKLNELKKEVERVINDGGTNIIVKGVDIKIFAEKFFNNSTVCCSGDCITQYLIEINEKGLRKLEKELEKEGIKE